MRNIWRAEAAIGVGKDAARAMSDTIPRSLVKMATALFGA